MQAHTAIAQDPHNIHATNTVNVTLTNNSTFQYDLNGNLTNDGLRNFVYDGENQLIQVAVSNQWMSQFAYDGKMRRRAEGIYVDKQLGRRRTSFITSTMAMLSFKNVI